MKPLELALKYMDIFFNGKSIEELGEILEKDLIFEGPFYKFTLARDYLDALRNSPPQGVKFNIVNSFENESSACLIYEFSKFGICTPMAQLFEIKRNKIARIVLIFDTDAFK